MTPRALVGALLALSAGAVALWLSARAPVAAFALAWIAITYLPVSNVVPLTAYFVAERYLYVPSFGLCLLAALALDRLGRERALALKVAAAILVAGAVRSRLRVRDWQDSVTLWTAALRVVPEGSARIHAELGRALLKEGRAEEAMPHLIKVMELEPTRPESFNDLGLAFLDTGRASDAVPYFRKALGVSPRNPLIRHNLATALLQAGQRDEAVLQLRVVASEEAWRDLPPAVLAAITQRGTTPEEFRARVRRWLERNDEGRSG